MTREELEAQIWRVLGLHASATIVDAILDAADKYATWEGGMTAVRRDELDRNLPRSARYACTKYQVAP